MITIIVFKHFETQFWWHFPCSHYYYLYNFHHYYQQLIININKGKAKKKKKKLLKQNIKMMMKEEKEKNVIFNEINIRVSLLRKKSNLKDWGKLQLIVEQSNETKRTIIIECWCRDHFTGILHGKFHVCSLEYFSLENCNYCKSAFNLGESISVQVWTFSHLSTSITIYSVYRKVLAW